VLFNVFNIQTIHRQRMECQLFSYIVLINVIVFHVTEQNVDMCWMYSILFDANILKQTNSVHRILFSSSTYIFLILLSAKSSSEYFRNDFYEFALMLY
jgi:hypothetical protein